MGKGAKEITNFLEENISDKNDGFRSLLLLLINYARIERKYNYVNNKRDK